MAAPYGNKNAEKWTLEETQKFLLKALELSKKREFDFIGEIARELDTYKEIFTYLIDKHKELKTLYITILTNIEANCFYNAKKGNIKEATAIVNLKSNHNWTDRQQIDQNHNIVWNEEKTYE